MRGMLTLMAMSMGAAGAPGLTESGQPQQPELAPTATTTPAPPSPDDLLGLGDVASRMTVPVSIGFSGPYAFVIDTGAERTVVSNELASQLNLASGRRVRVTTMTGTSDMGTFMLPALRAGKVAPSTLEAPAVEARNLGAPGMLGLDALKDHAVSIDFDKDVMEVRSSSKRNRGGSSGDIVIRAKNLYGQLIVTDARYGRQRISVVIDTGCPVTVGNLALLKKLRKSKSIGTVSLLSVTGQQLQADYRVVDTISIGGIGFNNVPIAFVDAVPFERFGLTEKPALMLGMDTLKLFRRVQIDFANREVRFTLPREAGDQPSIRDTIFSR